MQEFLRQMLQMRDVHVFYLLNLSRHISLSRLSLLNEIGAHHRQIKVNFLKNFIFFLQLAGAIIGKGGHNIQKLRTEVGRTIFHFIISAISLALLSKKQITY